MFASGVKFSTQSKGSGSGLNAERLIPVAECSDGPPAATRGRPIDHVPQNIKPDDTERCGSDSETEPAWRLKVILRVTPTPFQINIVTRLGSRIVAPCLC